jgi:NAD(P)-dependent dehydrogenase (short-subunit alcohol dehydrogenase family)
MEIKHKVALIVGGARIGQAVANELAGRGCHIGLTYRTSRAAAEETVGRVQSLGGRAVALQADLRSEEDNQRVPRETAQALGRLDVLIHMASVYQKIPLGSAGIQAWQDPLETDLRSAYLLSVHSAPFMKKQGGGRIILFSDWLAASGRPLERGYLPYYVAKHGVIGLAESLALELAPEILVNTVAPGPILKPGGLTLKEDQEVLKGTPLGRWGGPAEIAKAVVFLIETDFVTGECLRVDGGRHLR